MTVVRAVSFFDGTAIREGRIEADPPGLRLRPEPAPAGAPRLAGIVTGRFTDHHVHLQLVDPSLLARSWIGRVVDLGADPGVIRALCQAHASPTPEPARPGDAGVVRIEYAGAFLTAPGGYPSDRPWAPPGSVREITDLASAARAVAEMYDAGATSVKLTSNSTAGPVLDDDLFAALVRLAHARGLAVHAHAEGAGEAARVARLGADVLAHAPFTERLEDAEIARQAASVTWISTLAIHTGIERDHAIDNLRRFHAAGGTVRYGTDMGNGDTPVDLRVDEVRDLRAAGVTDAALLRALAPADPLLPGSALLLLPDGDPARAHPLAAGDLAHDPAPTEHGHDAPSGSESPAPTRRPDPKESA
ncbi:amidohydrolase family protein [Microbacterium resistens]|uniref:hypothetical protein n=1 Tax=Microbacterium resistens TaxID=156977 RepID=UPI000830C1FB|nr:hypothetical protein [Microbacterium resistens]